MDDFGIIFLHHATDPTTTNNLKLLQKYNPGVPIIPVCNWGQRLPGGVHTRDLKRGWRPFLPRLHHLEDRRIAPIKHLVAGTGVRTDFAWRYADLPIYMWATSGHGPRARRWVVMEWDVFANVPLRPFYDAVWDADLAGTNLHDPKTDTEWPHFSEYERIRVPDKYRPSLYGVHPIAGLLFSEENLRAVSEEIRANPDLANTYCEVRVGVIAKHLGLDIREIGPHAQETLRGLPVFPVNSLPRPGVWHKVKDHEVFTDAPVPVA